MINPPASDLPETISNPARRALASIGVDRLDQLATHREADIARLHGMGPKGIRQLREALSEHGLSFARELSCRNPFAIPTQE